LSLTETLPILQPVCSVYFTFKGILDAASAVLNASKRVEAISDEAKTIATIFYLLYLARAR
jgi:hypothetical protein